MYLHAYIVNKNRLLSISDGFQCSSHRDVQYAPSWCIGVPSRWGRGCHIIKRKVWPWNILRVPHSLHITYLICRFRKRVDALFPLQRISFSSLSNSPYFPSGIHTSFPRLFHFCIVYIYYWTYCHHEYAWNICAWLKKQ